MNDLLLDRFAYSPLGTFGRLTDGQWWVFTCEPPWAKNAVGLSCIPDGTYDLRPARYNHGGHDTLEVLNVPGRTGILFHRGNTADDTDGCILLGMGLGVVGGTWGITNSANAWASFADLVSNLGPPSAITIRPVGGTA